MANRDTSASTREEIRAAVACVLMAHVRRAGHPSVTHLSMLEETLPPVMQREYLELLFDKAMCDGSPNIPLLARIRRFADTL